MSYTYTYPRPAVTVDCMIFLPQQDSWHLLLIQRDKPPFEGSWALPGGFVEIEEPLPTAAQRELEEETGLSQIPVHQFYTFGQPGRDPRGRNISVVYYAFLNTIPPQAKAGSDARKAAWFDIHHPPALAFDHQQILDLAIEKLNL